MWPDYYYYYYYYSGILRSLLLLLLLSRHKRFITITITISNSLTTLHGINLDLKHFGLKHMHTVFLVAYCISHHGHVQSCHNNLEEFAWHGLMERLAPGRQHTSDDLWWPRSLYIELLLYSVSCWVAESPIIFWTLKKSCDNMPPWRTPLKVLNDVLKQLPHLTTNSCVQYHTIKIVQEWHALFLWWAYQKRHQKVTRWKALDASM